MKINYFRFYYHTLSLLVLLSISMVFSHGQTTPSAVTSSTSTNLPSPNLNSTNLPSTITAPAQGAASANNGKLSELRSQGKTGHSMAQEIGLTADQKAKMIAAFRALRQQAELIRHDSALTVEQKREKLDALRQTMKANLASILTPAQVVLLERIQKGRLTARSHLLTIGARHRVVQPSAPSTFAPVTVPVSKP